jgi:hypothetical protein
MSDVVGVEEQWRNALHHICGLNSRSAGTAFWLTLPDNLLVWLESKVI